LLNHKIPVELPTGYIDFFKDLESWQNQETIKIKNNYTPAPSNILKKLMQERKPLIMTVKPQIEASALKDVYSRLLDFLLGKRPEIRPELDKLKSAIPGLDFDEITMNFIRIRMAYFEELATAIGVVSDLFFFTIDHAIRPFLRVFAETYRDDLGSNNFHWDFPATCPICGYKSHFSRLKVDNGERFMFCDRCFAEWKVVYLRCVYCGHDRPGDITYLSVSNDDAFQVYVCSKCKGYLKTYDERGAARMVDMFIANMETIYLDILATDKGYTNHDED
jgi:FdhE protein